MNRRTTLKNLLIASGGLITLPTWAQHWTPNDLTTLPSAFSTANQELLASVADTIIPTGNSIGALSVGVDKFLQKLITGCYASDVQENVNKQLTALDNNAKRTYGNAFAACDQMQRQALLEKFGVSEDTSEQDFFNLMKSETIRGFNTSREVMLQHLNYKILPGHFHGCVDITA